jgi:hypothetical protein
MNFRKWIILLWSFDWMKLFSIESHIGIKLLYEEAKLVNKDEWPCDTLLIQLYQKKIIY